MFSYYGSKSKIVGHYPSPKYDTVIEPFAGSARYALKYYEKDVILIEKYYKVAEIWKYLISSTERDILALPDEVEDLRIHNELMEVEKWLIGYELGRGSARPRNKPSKLYSNWKRAKERIASDIHKIKHWKIIHGEYDCIENIEATWYVDAPYQIQSHRYDEQITDYTELAEYCKSRNGQVIVCENSNGATWLPFVPLVENNGIRKTTTEMVYIRG